MHQISPLPNASAPLHHWHELSDAIFKTSISMSDLSMLVLLLQLLSFGDVQMAFWPFCTFGFPRFPGFNLHVIIDSSGWCQGRLHDDVMLTMAGTWCDSETLGGRRTLQSTRTAHCGLRVTLLDQNQKDRFIVTSVTGLAKVILCAGSPFCTSARKLARLASSPGSITQSL